MGSRSKSRSSNTSGQTQSTMNNLAKGRVSNSSMMDILSELQNSQAGGILPIFDALIQNGNSMMGSNPMMPMFGGQQPQAPQEPLSLSDIFQAMQPQQPPQQPPPFKAPQMGPMGQSGIGAMPNMTPEQIAAIQNMQGYGRR